MSVPDTEFLEIFRDEAGGRLDRIVDTLLALENGSAGADAVDSLFRDTHTIKGAAGMVGLPEISGLAHVMEELLADARQQGTLPCRLRTPSIAPPAPGTTLRVPSSETSSTFSIGTA